MTSAWAGGSSTTRKILLKQGQPVQPTALKMMMPRQFQLRLGSRFFRCCATSPMPGSVVSKRALRDFAFRPRRFHDAITLHSALVSPLAPSRVWQRPGDVLPRGRDRSCCPCEARFLRNNPSRQGRTRYEEQSVSEGPAAIISAEHRAFIPAKPMPPQMKEITTSVFVAAAGVKP